MPYCSPVHGDIGVQAGIVDDSGKVQQKDEAQRDAARVAARKKRTSLCSSFSTLRIYRVAVNLACGRSI